jgi:tripeptide aminopeptidase
MQIDTEKLLARFLAYVQMDTRSDERSESCPSTEKQWAFAQKLKEELQQIGLAQVKLDQHAYLTAELPATTDKTVPTIGFISHMDTSPDMPGAHARPQVLRDYNGEDVVLNDSPYIIMPVSLFPELAGYKGQTLIHTDGTTLLGADDKAGIADIVTAIEYLCTHQEIPHGTIKIGFTPDEEIGRGTDYFDVQAFGADFAYTVDGGALGELEYENFNAARAEIIIQGCNTHPGTARGHMLNSLYIAMELAALLPAGERPEYTDGYEGFYHLNSFTGNVEKSRMTYIIRDHDKNRFLARKQLMENIVTFLKQKYGDGVVQLALEDQYYNMREKIEPVLHIVKTAEKAIQAAGLTPVIKPIRGGTDGARLTYLGLPCPNLFTGGHNYHGKFEYIPLESMVQAVRVILKIIELVAAG